MLVSGQREDGQWGTGPGHPNACGVGAWHRIKGVDVLVAACGVFPAPAPPWGSDCCGPEVAFGPPGLLRDAPPVYSSIYTSSVSLVRAWSPGLCMCGARLCQSTGTAGPGKALASQKPLGTGWTGQRRAELSASKCVCARAAPSPRPPRPALADWRVRVTWPPRLFLATGVRPGLTSGSFGSVRDDGGGRFS